MMSFRGAWISRMQFNRTNCFFLLKLKGFLCRLYVRECLLDENTLAFIRKDLFPE
jgi:hypothetical protein